MSVPKYDQIPALSTEDDIDAPWIAHIADATVIISRSREVREEDVRLASLPAFGDSKIDIR